MGSENKRVERRVSPRKKKRQSFFGNLFTQYELMYMLVCLVALAVAVGISVGVTKKFDIDSLFEVKTFSAVVVVFVLNAVTNVLIRSVRSKREDNDKLISDYDKLLKMYVNASPVVYRNSAQANYRVGRKHTRCSHTESAYNEDTYKIPLADVISFIGKKVVIYDEPDAFYKLPAKIDDAMTDLYKAHHFSNTYNQMNIRCCGITVFDDTVNMSFSRTTYLHSLITNRAMDFKKDGISVRDLCAYGPFLPALEQSELSNHIGFNGFVETSDGHIVFIFRHKRVSIAKKTLQSSVGASLKVKYALNEYRLLTKDGIVNAIKNEIEDELNLSNLPQYEERKTEIFRDLTFDSVLCFYRELVEGGKPQFMFYTKINVTRCELIAAYTGGIKTARRRHDRFGLYNKIDGYKMLTVHRNDLRKIYVTPDGITVGKKFYKSVPSSSGTFALFIKYLESGEIKCN